MTAQENRDQAIAKAAEAFANLCVVATAALTVLVEEAEAEKAEAEAEARRTQRGEMR